MKASAEKSSVTASKTAARPASPPFFAKAGGGNFFAPAGRTTVPSVQMKMTVGKTGDKFEREADKMADKVMRMPSPASSAKEEKIQRKADEKLQKKENEKLQKAPAEDKLQRKGNDAAPSVSPTVQSAIRSKTSGGQPLSADVRRDMESRFNADFSKVRIHSNAEAAGLSNQLSARAFTHKNHIFFSRNQYQPGTSEGRQLLAHELTHTIQQGHAVQRSPQVSTTVTPPQVQRAFWDNLPNPLEYLLDKALDFITKNASAIPGFTMLTVVIGFNPITRAAVDRSAGNILKGAIEMIPGGSFITQALDNHGVFDKVSTFASQQFAALKNIGSNVWQDIKEFVKKFELSDLANPGAVWERAKNIVTSPIDQIKSFAIGLKDGIVSLIKDAILKPIAAFAKANIPNGYDLLCAVLGKDPISGEPVPQTAENLIGPFMKLIGQEEVWENMKKANAIGRAWSWFQKALSAVKGFVQELPSLFISALKALEITDIILIPRAFLKLASVFGGFAVRFVTWAGTAVWNLLEIIFDAVSPGALSYIKKTGSAIKSIFKNPLPFVGNLVKAAKQGFLNFADNIGGHLKAGLIDWLTGSLEGVYIPKALNLMELGKFAMSVLGITWTQIRGKIVKVLGKNGETIMKGLETGFDLIVKLVTGGPAALWEMIKEKLSDLKDTVVSGIISFVTETIVKKAIPKLIAMFIPGAGFISAIISIYDTVMVFVEKLAKIIQVVTAFIDSIVTIAGGNISAAAKRVESILGGLLSLAISFLAGFLGLGKVTDKIMAVIQKVRGTVDKAIDAAINWIVTKAKALFGKLFGGKDKKKDERTEEQKNKDKLAALAEANRLVNPEDFDEDVVRSKLNPIKTRFKLSRLDLMVESQTEEDETFHFEAAASKANNSPSIKAKKGKEGLKTLQLTRPKWIETKEFNIYIQVKEKHEAAAKADADGNSKRALPGVFKKDGRFKVGRKWARRHILSSYDMKNHYEEALILPNKTFITAGQALKTEPKKNSIKSSAQDRLSCFHNEVNNLWVGTTKENSRLQENVDPSPDMYNKKDEIDIKKIEKHIQKMANTYGIPGKKQLTVSSKLNVEIKMNYTVKE